jgi:hypothetical protein
MRRTHGKGHPARIVGLKTSVAAARCSRQLPWPTMFSTSSTRYQNIREKKLFLDWVLTAKTHYYTDKWIEIFKKCGYTGYWNWTILKSNE